MPGAAFPTRSTGAHSHMCVHSPCVCVLLCACARNALLSACDGLLPNPPPLGSAGEPAAADEHHYYLIH